MQRDSPDTWQFELYTIGDNRRSALALENLRGICHDHLHDHCHISVIDIRKHPELCAEKNICGSPYLIRTHPLPQKRMIGDLSSTDKALEALDIDHSKEKHGDGKAYQDGLEKQDLNAIRRHERPQR